MERLRNGYEIETLCIVRIDLACSPYWDRENDRTVKRLNRKNAPYRNLQSYTQTTILKAIS